MDTINSTESGSTELVVRWRH